MAERIPFTIQSGIAGVCATDLQPFTMLGLGSQTGVRILQMLEGSEIVAIAKSNELVIGYGAVIGDGCMFAFLTALEVIPEWRGEGVGSQIVAHLRECLKGRYAFDLACDSDLVHYYSRLGFTPGVAMLSRNYESLR